MLAIDAADRTPFPVKSEDARYLVPVASRVLHPDHRLHRPELTDTFFHQKLLGAELLFHRRINHRAAAAASGKLTARCSLLFKRRALSFRLRRAGPLRRRSSTLLHVFPLLPAVCGGPCPSGTSPVRALHR